MVWVTQSAVRLACEHPRLAPPMYMLAALNGEAANHVDMVVSGCAVQASKPSPVYVVSNGVFGEAADERVALPDVRLVVAAVEPSAADSVRASAAPEGASTSAVPSAKVTDCATCRAAAVSSPAETTTETGESSAVTTRSGATTPCRLSVVRCTASVRPTRCGGQVLRLGSPR